MRKFLQSSTLYLLLGLVIISGCRKEDPELDVSGTLDYVLVENTYADVKCMLDESLSPRLSSFRLHNNLAILGSCEEIVFDTTGSRRTITIDFNTTGCEGKDHRFRSGKVIFVTNKNFKQDSAIIDVTFNNYVVDGVSVSGNMSVLNLGRYSDGFRHYSINIDGILRKPKRTPIVWKTNHIWVWNVGEDTPLVRFDDQYSITAGISNGLTSDSLTYHAEITKELVRSVVCHEFVSGKIDFTPQGKEIRLLDFGNGFCDGEAYVTIGKNSKKIQLIP